VTIKPADESITEDDAFIARALECANIPTLMMALVHLTGDTSILDGHIQPRVSMLALDGTLSEEAKSEVRMRALSALVAYRDSGCGKLPPPSPATVRQMMSLLTAGMITDEYQPMLSEEMALDGIDRRRFTWTGGRAPAAAKQFHTVIIGAGMSGIAAAIRLSEAGMPFVIVEKNLRPAGTWWENTYPGCRVDSMNHFYSYSFEPNHDWSEFFCQREELFRYFDMCVDKYVLRQHILFSTEVREARYDEKTGRWKVKIRGPDGAEETLTADAIVSGVGQLNRPKLPDIKGRETFKGPAFHSAQWEHAHDLGGKRVGVIGTGASAFQLIPEVAQVAGKLTVFQRTPVWMAPNPDYHAHVEAGKKWLLKHVPYYAKWYRFLLFWVVADGAFPLLKIDPSWPNQDISVNPFNDQIRLFFEGAMRSQLEGRPDLVEKLVPKYPAFIKRLLQDNGHYLNTFKRSNVELVTEDIAGIVADGIVDGTGRHHPLDVIVYATGFHTNKFLWPMRIVGRNGKVLSEVWGDEPRAYLGITIPDFPNLFCLYGPSTNLAHGGSIIFHTECQVRYVAECLKYLLESGNAAIECKHESYNEYVTRLEETLATMVWSHPGANSWYKNERGVVVNTSPWRLIDYWNWTKTVNPADYRLIPVPIGPGEKRNDRVESLIRS
jgi:4-hydroxyacetophenone monooxygenase